MVRLSYDIGLIVILVIVLPIILCILFRLFPLGSVGPFVPITGVINIFALPILSYMAMGRIEIANRHKIARIIAAIVSGAILAIIGMNLFMFISSIFGIMDYQPM